MKGHFQKNEKFVLLHWVELLCNPEKIINLIRVEKQKKKNVYSVVEVFLMREHIKIFDILFVQKKKKKSN